MSYTTNRTVRLQTNVGDNGRASEMLDLDVSEELVGIRTAIFLISEVGSVEPPAEVIVDLSTGDDGPVHYNKDDVELPGAGLCTIESAIHSSGKVEINLVHKDDEVSVGAYVSAKLEIEIENVSSAKSKKTEETQSEEDTPPWEEERPVVEEVRERPDIRKHAVKGTVTTGKMVGREDRVIYHTGQDELIFVVGMEEDVSDREPYRLSKSWTRENVASLSSSDYNVVKGESVGTLSFDRAVSMQEKLDSIVRGMYGVPTLVGWWKGVTYYLPLVDHDQNPIDPITLTSMDFDFWKEVKQMLPREFDDLKNAQHETIVNARKAMSIQTEWSFTMRQGN